MPPSAPRLSLGRIMGAMVPLALLLALAARARVQKNLDSVDPQLVALCGVTFVLLLVLLLRGRGGG